MIHRLLAVLFLLASVPGGAFAGGRSAGASSLIIGKLPVGTRAIALSGAFTALADDASAVWWNPAGLSLVARPGLAVLHVEQGEKVRMENVLFSVPVAGGGTAGGGVSYLGMPPITETFETADGEYGGEGAGLDAWEIKAAGGYGQDLSRWGDLPALGPLWERGSLGATVAVVGERIGPDSTYAVSVDAGYLYNDPAGGRRFALVARSLGTPARGAPLPVTGQVGVAQAVGRWNVAAEFLTAADDSYRVRGGIEWTLAGESSEVTLRGGAQHSFASHLSAELSTGLGYRLSLPGGFSLAVDYAYVPVTGFEDLHAVSLETLF